MNDLYEKNQRCAEAQRWGEKALKVAYFLWHLAQLASTVMLKALFFPL
jgi:hypothetical protein